MEDTTFTIKFSISCQHLQGNDESFFFLIYDQELGRTEKTKEILSSGNKIQFLNCFQKGYNFSKRQELVFSLFKSDEFYGKFECRISQLLHHRGSLFGQIHHPNKKEVLGEILINVEEVTSENLKIEKKPQHEETTENVDDLLIEVKKLFYEKDDKELQIFFEKIRKTYVSTINSVRMQFSIDKLEKKNLFYLSNAYVKISKKENENEELIYQSEVVPNTLHPSFKSFDLDIKKFGDGEIHFNVWNAGLFSEKYIGGFTTTFEELKHKKVFLLHSGKFKNNFRRYEHSGIFQIAEFHILEEKREEMSKVYKSVSNEFNIMSQSSSEVLNGEKYAEIETPFSFVDHLTGGLELETIIAIDFTKSNGETNSKSNFHHIEPGRDNQYETIIKSTSNLLSDYSGSQEISAFGFGAIVQKFNETTHCFPIHDTGSECHGVDELIEEYHKTVEKIEFSGPTLYHSILEKSNAIAEQSKEIITKDKYFVLVIIAAGDLFDVEKSVNQIIESTKNPISIVIIGIGDNKYELMKILDSSKKPLYGSNGIGKRDNIHFITMKKFIEEPEKMYEILLKSIPNQVVTYFTQNDILPRNKIQVFME